MSDKPKIVGIRNLGPGDLRVSWPNTEEKMTLRPGASVYESDLPHGLNSKDALVYAVPGQRCDVEYIRVD